jgi:hypothetical protein
MAKKSRQELIIKCTNYSNHSYQVRKVRGVRIKIIMNKYKYILEPYTGIRSRYECPRCRKKHEFARYIVKETGNYLGTDVGKCNRDINCGYHYPPKKFFSDNNESNCRLNLKEKNLNIVQPENKTKGDSISFIPKIIFKSSLANYRHNHFVNFLFDLFGEARSEKLIKKYYIGTSDHWNGATIFWQIDKLNRVRAGKIMLYNRQTGKRIKEPFNHVSWIHKKIGNDNFNLKQCLFGEHLLNGNNKPIGLVESEKTAIIANVYLPEFLWLACGSLSNLNLERCRILSNKSVFLFPDLKGYKKWEQKSIEIRKYMNCKISVSDFLEKNASENEKNAGLDIADYLIKRDEKFGWALSENDYPLFWDE